ncbi:MAG: DUF1015 domain-containing protein, partial [Oscillospiraceae bacterium]
PEAYLEADDVANRIEKASLAMDGYLSAGFLNEYVGKYIYVERTQRSGVVRHGLMGVIDLMEYDYRVGSQTAVRATEGTVISRIPPRVRVRESASLELPHIMLLIDDEACTVIEPLASNKDECCYDFDLMQNSGHLRGYVVSDAEAKRIDNALLKLSDPTAFAKKYDVPESCGVLTFAVGDGNHSLATATVCYMRLKTTMSDDAWQCHPARYALVELTNLHDAALEFEPIHRVVFDVDPSHMLAELARTYTLSSSGGQHFRYITKDGSGEIHVENAPSNLAVGTLQRFIDTYIKEFGGRVDYIHGDDVTARLASEPGNIGFLLPNMEKRELFKTVILDGALPRKTFSMGHAFDKRFYLECRKIK